jgi:hypothetical protein
MTLRKLNKRMVVQRTLRHLHLHCCGRILLLLLPSFYVYAGFDVFIGL